MIDASQNAQAAIQLTFYKIIGIWTFIQQKTVYDTQSNRYDFREISSSVK